MCDDSVDYFFEKLNMQLENIQIYKYTYYQICYHTVILYKSTAVIGVLLK